MPAIIYGDCVYVSEVQQRVVDYYEQNVNLSMYTSLCHYMIAISMFTGSGNRTGLMGILFDVGISGKSKVMASNRKWI